MTILLNRILNTFKENIIPLTKKSVESGNKIFGAAILKKEDFSIVVTGTNNEIENPLWHGEVHTLKKFYELPKEKRPSEKNCLFISSHEPCSLCLSAITFAGFDNFYYLFPYQSTSDEFNIPHDLNILKEVFNVKEGKYIKKNSYWKSISIISLINELPKEKVKDIMIALNNIKNTYKELSKKYQSNKATNNIPLK
jgi:tRNA(Arg) A34 adenosine deaminase TadA